MRPQLFRAIVQLLITIPAMACVRANPLGPKGQRLLVYLQGQCLDFILITLLLFD